MNQQHPGGSIPAQRLSGAFTLIELLSVIVIVASLLGVAVPAIGSALEKGRQVACGSNLRQLVTLVQLAAADNDGRIPHIETDPTNPIYEAEVGAKGLLETLRPYGATEAVVRCASDLRGPNYYKTRGTSYEWRPFVDDERLENLVIYGRRGDFVVTPSLCMLLWDFESVHNGRKNKGYANGRVVIR